MGTLTALLLTGCTISEPNYGVALSPVRISGKVAFTARNAFFGDSLVIYLTAHNQGSGTARTEFGSCAFIARGTAADGTTWGAEGRQAGCTDELRILQLNPGETREFRDWGFYRWREQWPPPGTSRIMVFYLTGGRIRTIPAGQVEVPSSLR
jgi:hypothetical protein